MDVDVFGASFDDQAVDTDSLRSSRSAKAGARAVRMIRLIRLIRMIRLVKLMKIFMEWHRKRQERQDLEKRNTYFQPGEAMDFNVLNSAEDAPDDDEQPQDLEESRVGKNLFEKTTQKVVILVLLMLFLLPRFSAESALEPPFSSLDYGANIVQRKWEQTQGFVSGPERSAYEYALLQYAYYHSWDASWKCQSGLDDEICQRLNSGQNLIWIGYKPGAVNSTNANIHAANVVFQNAQPQILTDDWANRSLDQWNGLLKKNLENISGT